jgi:hypothetical protein
MHHQVDRGQQSGGGFGITFPLTPSAVSSSALDAVKSVSVSISGGKMVRLAGGRCVFDVPGVEILNWQEFNIPDRQYDTRTTVTGTWNNTRLGDSAPTGTTAVGSIGMQVGDVYAHMDIPSGILPSHKGRKTGWHQRAAGPDRKETDAEEEERKAELMAKRKARTLTREDAEELQPILDREAAERHARQQAQVDALKAEEQALHDRIHAEARKNEKADRRRQQKLETKQKKGVLTQSEREELEDLLDQDAAKRTAQPTVPSSKPPVVSRIRTMDSRQLDRTYPICNGGGLAVSCKRDGVNLTPDAYRMIMDRCVAEGAELDQSTWNYLEDQRPQRGMPVTYAYDTKSKHVIEVQYDTSLDDDHGPVGNWLNDKARRYQGSTQQKVVDKVSGLVGTVVGGAVKGAVLLGSGAETVEELESYSRVYDETTGPMDLLGQGVHATAQAGFQALGTGEYESRVLGDASVKVGALYGATRVVLRPTTAPKGPAGATFAESAVTSGEATLNPHRANSANAQAALKQKMSALEKAANLAERTEILPDGRIRYYAQERLSSTPGATRGASFVTEFNPKTGQVRTWNECYDHSGNVNRVHPKGIDGQTLKAPHYPMTKSELEKFLKSGKK